MGATQSDVTAKTIEGIFPIWFLTQQFLADTSVCLAGLQLYLNLTNLLYIFFQIIICIALSLSFSNLYGYIRCKLGKSEGVTNSLKSFANTVIQKQMISNVSIFYYLRWKFCPVIIL